MIFCFSIFLHLNLNLNWEISLILVARPADRWVENGPTWAHLLNLIQGCYGSFSYFLSYIMSRLIFPWSSYGFCINIYRFRSCFGRVEIGMSYQCWQSFTRFEQPYASNLRFSLIFLLVKKCMWTRLLDSLKFSFKPNLRMWKCWTLCPFEQ